MRRSLDRREFLHSLSGVAAGLHVVCGGTTHHATAALNAPKARITFGYGTYGMPSLSLEEAIEATSKLGYDTIEICVRPEWNAAPDQLSTDRRRAIRKQLSDSGLKISALMEHVFPSEDDQAEAKTRERLKRVAAMGRELLGDGSDGEAGSGVIQTVLGGGTWEQKQNLFVDRLSAWGDIAREQDFVIAIKPHRGGAMSRPAEGVWIINQLDDSPQIRLVYDYSHYIYRDMKMLETLNQALPYLAHVAIKDAYREGDRVGFDLPGSRGTIDYEALLRHLQTRGYRGDVCCEVSSMVSRQKGFDPHRAARSCYEHIKPVFDALEQQT